MVKYHEKCHLQEMKEEEEGKQSAFIIVILGVSRDRELSAFEGGTLSAVISADSPPANRSLYLSRPRWSALPSSAKATSAMALVAKVQKMAAMNPPVPP